MASQIDLGAVVPIGKGDWNASTTYERTNIVRHNSTAWICKVATSIGVEPSEDSSDWYLLVKDISSVTSVNGMRGDVNINSIPENPSTDDNSLKIASTSWVKTKVDNITNELNTQISQTNSTANVALQTANSALTGCLPLTGGTMTGNIATTAVVALSKSDNNSYIQINGGTSWENGASINLNSKDSKENIGGSFLLYAKDASAESCLFGLPNGSLTWCDSQVFLPVGAVFAFAANAHPSGCLICNGAAVSRTTYATLFAAIGTTYGAGDGSTTFNLPNLTDRFIQGSDTAGKVNAAGLPEIYGYFSQDRNAYSGFGVTWDGTDAFSSVWRSSSSKKIAKHYSDGDYTDGEWLTIFSAKGYNPIYGASTTVQPPALTMRFYIKY